MQATRSGELTVTHVSRPIRPRYRAAYLFFKFRITTINPATASMIINSSYVVISFPLSARLGLGTGTPSAALVSILLFVYRNSERWLLSCICYNIFSKTASKGGQGSPPGKYCIANSRPFFTREQGGYFLCVYVRIATISNAMEVINCNSSYVLIDIPSCTRLRRGTTAALLAALVSILLFVYRNSERSLCT